jgi:endonuclease III
MSAQKVKPEDIASGEAVVSLVKSLSNQPTKEEMLKALENIFVQIVCASPQTRRELNYTELQEVIQKARGLK